MEQKEEHVGWHGAIRNREKACAKREAFVRRTRPRGAHDWCLVMRNVGGAPSCYVVQRIVHHAVEVEHQEARVEVGGSARSADLAMPSARAAASCAASPRTGVRRHARS